MKNPVKVAFMAQAEIAISAGKSFPYVEKYGTHLL